MDYTLWVSGLYHNKPSNKARQLQLMYNNMLAECMSVNGVDEPLLCMNTNTTIDKGNKNN